MSFSVGERCIYRCVVVMLAWPASSLIAITEAPRIARCEQKVWRRMCNFPFSVPPSCASPCQSGVKRPFSRRLLGYEHMERT